MAKKKGVKVKCAFTTCPRWVGPGRIKKKKKICYVCERNLDDWGKKGSARRVVWHARVGLFNERLETFPKFEQEQNKVAAFVAQQFKRNLKKVA